MYQAFDFLLEARRRDYMNLTNRFIEASNLWIYNYYNNETKSFHFDFKERIVPEKRCNCNEYLSRKRREILFMN